MITTVLNLAMVGALGSLYVLQTHVAPLPTHRWLLDYRSPLTTRVYASNGSRLAAYAREHRVRVPLNRIPERVIRAFLAAEDADFFTHPGIDLPAILRAAVVDLRRLGSGQRPIGASTISQQVARHFLLSREVTLERKLREMVLAWRLEALMGKRGVLDLYLNEIYLGRGAYGVAAAAQTYFDKALGELGLAEAAFLAGLPKAPAHYDPARAPDAAKARRNWVLGQMADAGFIDRQAAAAAKSRPLALNPPPGRPRPSARHFAETVRRRLAARFGTTALYAGGLSVRTTMDPALQALAQRALRAGLIAYDRRHGWRGPVARLAAVALDDPAARARALANVDRPPAAAAWRLAVVVAVDEAFARLVLAGGGTGLLPLAELAWARTRQPGQRLGPPVHAVPDVLRRGDVVLVEPVRRDPAGRPDPPDTYALRQVPEVNGGLVALDPRSGRVLALSGGYSYRPGRDEFNRATQARRQPGSAIKPFVYLAALEQGYTPASIFRDEPVALPLGRGRGLWRPRNYAGRYLGARPMRVGLEQSRNVMTVRIARRVGMANVAEVAERFGITAHMPHQLAQAIGAGETTLLRLTTAYAMFANGGRRIAPRLIERVQDRDGGTLYRTDTRSCAACTAVVWQGQAPPELADGGTQIADPVRAYQIVSMLEGVVQRGTGRRLQALKRPVAGKTGTTNASKDAWFIGFTPELVVGVYVGFDRPRTLGPRETGSRVAAPIVADVLAGALAGVPPRPFPIPRGVHLRRVRLADGRPARPGDTNVVLEAFKAGNVPEVAGAENLRRDDQPDSLRASTGAAPDDRRVQTAEIPSLGPVY